MQRQSLGGSPGSQVYIHGVAKEDKLYEEEHKRKNGEVDDEEEIKVEKIYHRSTSRTEKFIHLIPIITILCLLVLYLCSYDPSQKDLLHFDGFGRNYNKLDSTAINYLERFTEIKKGDVLSIRNHRSLHEAEKYSNKSRFHRKIGDF